MYESLFTPYELKKRIISNRFVAQAMEINTADSGGSVGKTVLNRYQQLARGDWGIVSLEATSITDQHLARKSGLVLTEKNLDGFKRLVDMFKKINPSTILLFQLTHSGRQSGEFSKKVKVYQDEDDSIPVLTEEELDRIREQYAQAVELSYLAGADGVDVKACHGYLGSELIRPKNTRTDKYGGSIEGRAYLVTSVLKDALDRFPDLIVGSRFSIFEGIRGGCGTRDENQVLENLEDIKKIITCIVDSGADYLNVSAGIPSITPYITRPSRKADYIRLNHYRYTSLVKKMFPSIAVIGSAYTTYDNACLSMAAENVAENHTDFVGFGRQNLADPLFPIKVKETIADIDFCSLCGRCSQLLKKNDQVFCVTHNSEYPY